jgi:hypothetical protein
LVILRGRDELAVGVLDNDNVAVDLACKDSRNRSLPRSVKHHLGTWRKDVLDVEIVIFERDFFVIENKGKTL